MYMCIIKMEDDKAVAALRAARRLSPEAWQVIREVFADVLREGEGPTECEGLNPASCVPSDEKAVAE